MPPANPYCSTRPLYRRTTIASTGNCLLAESSWAARSSGSCSRAGDGVALRNETLDRTLDACLPSPAVKLVHSPPSLGGDAWKRGRRRSHLNHRSSTPAAAAHLQPPWRQVGEEGGAVEQHKLAGRHQPRVAGGLQAAQAVEEQDVAADGGRDLRAGNGRYDGRGGWSRGLRKLRDLYRTPTQSRALEGVMAKLGAALTMQRACTAARIAAQLPAESARLGGACTPHACPPPLQAPRLELPGLEAAYRLGLDAQPL